MVDELDEASSLHTPTARLAELARSKRAEVRRAVAKNASVQLATAAELCGEWPAEFLDNPSLPLWRLENPALLQQLPPASARALAQHPGLPLAHLGELVEHPNNEVRYQVAQSSLVTVEILERLGTPQPGQPPDYRINLAVAQHPKTPERLLERLRSMTYGSDALIRNPRTPPYLVRDLSFSSDAAGRVWVLRSAHYPAALYPAAERKAGVVELSHLASSPAAPATTLRRLARDPDASVRRAAASNPRTPLFARLALLIDKNSSVRRASLETPLPRHPRP